jgi:pre-mRNA-processing factor 19
MATQSQIKLDFVTLDVFTSVRFLGNPLAVIFVPSSIRPSISQEAKQRIAREFNLSETVFLHLVENEPNTTITSREVDIFTIGAEISFAGHPTVGTAYLILNHLGWTHVDTLVTRAGPIHIETEGNFVTARIPHDVHIHRRTLRDVVEASSQAQGLINMALSNDKDVREAELRARPVSIVKGMTFLLVELPNTEKLALVSTDKRFDFGRVDSILDEGPWKKGFVGRYYYVLTKSPNDGGSWGIRTRMIELGFEDPATGSAASSLASYLTLTEQNPNAGRITKFNITQGVEMGRRSDISVQIVQENLAVDGQPNIKELSLRGTSVVVMRGTITA